MSGLYDSILTYVSVYKSTAVNAWNHMTPQQYASILLLVGVIGFISMRGKSR